ncbi:hypothetical protein SAMN04488498_101291 [Mesorhizobium albiziae]|uniref:Uncharacterized protein n=1 Tax=Neomesorhizobium albiziae TaxID=335020 RepID=A0A1I3VA21_9HYPH|nr:hypothetical protein [Mesorhizobium albiziae]SFJ91859.1 hypothetical protein SAMN04488498_101291 [Mesorhizobium albiziae]
MADTKHSMKEAVAIQRAFEERFGDAGLVGVGIGLNPRQDDLALNVFVAREKEAQRLPKTFDGLDVVVDVVGVIRAF